MATQGVSIEASWYASSGGASWVESNQIYSGASGSNYRSCVRLRTGDFDGTASNIVVSFKINGKSSPAGMYGVLSTNGSIATNCVVSDNYYGSYTNGPHASYLGSGASGYIAESDTYSDAGCTTLQGSYNQTSGHVVYLKFSSSAIRPNTVYYLYLMRYIKSGDSTSSGWTQGLRTDMGATLTYTQNTYYIDVNTYINGGGSTTNANITYNVNINGSRVASGVQDYYTAWPKGTTWSISNASCSGYTCTNSTNTSGTLGTSSISSQWSFSSLHTLTLNPNGGSFSDGGTSAKALSPNLIYGHGNWWDISGHPVTKTGHTFNGWYTAASGGTKVYNANGSCVTGTAYWNSSKQYTQAANLTVYAQWTANTWPVSYNANGGKSTPTAQTKTYGVTLTLAADPGHDPSTKTITTTFDANGGSVSPASRNTTASLPYTFAGWKATNGTVYSAGGNYTANEGTTMTAQWTSGSWSGASVSLPTPTRSGYSFDGWYTAKTGGTKKTSYSPTANSTLYAHWTPNTYTVTVFDQFSGAVLAEQDVAYGSSITLPAISAEPYYMLAADMDLVFDDSSGYLDSESVHIYGYQKQFPLYYYDTYGGGTWTTTYTHTYPSDVEIHLVYEPTSSYDVDFIEFKALEQVKNKENVLAYWSRVSGPSWLPIKITPGSVVNLDVQLSEEAFYDGEWAEYNCVYEPTALNYVWVKKNGTYQLGTPLFKFNSKFDHNNYYFIKKDGEWTNLLRWLNLQAAAAAEAKKAAEEGE